MEQTFFSLLMPGAQVTNRMLMSECIANNFGGSRDLERTFIHSFLGSSIQHSLSTHHVFNTVLGTENSAKHTSTQKSWLTFSWAKADSVCVLVIQLCLTLCDPMDCSLLASSVHGILQARILEWVAIPFSRASS